MRFKYIFILSIHLLGTMLFGTDSNVSKIGSWGTGLYNDVVAKGHYAYIAAGWNGLDIIDISHPSNPSLIGNLNLSAEAYTLDVNGTYAYVACSDGLHIVDVSIPASPKITALYGFSPYNRERTAGIIADGNYVYLASISERIYSCFITVLDVTDPARPQPTESSIYCGDWISISEEFPLQKVGQYLFFKNPNAQSLEIYDVSIPTSPQHKNSINSVNTFAINGNYAYIIDNDLKILNIADPAAPVNLGTCAINNDVQDIFAAGHYLYLTEYLNPFQWQIQIVNVSNPLSPHIISTCPVPAAPVELVAIGSTALVAAKRHGLFIFDIGKPTSPKLLKKYDFSGLLSDIFTTGDRSYVVDDDGELKIFAATTPSSPVLLGQYTAPTSISGISVNGNYAYLATVKSGLQIIDVKDPTKPVTTSSYCFGCEIYDVEVKGNYAYVLQYPQTFSILDLTNPVAPLPLGQIQVNGAGKIYISNNYAFLAGEYGVVMIDIADPNAPALVSDLYGGRYTWVDDVYVQGSYIYVANNNGSRYSLDIFDFSVPSAPVLIGRFFIKNIIYDIWVKENYAYLVTSSGLDVIDVLHPGAPKLIGRLDDIIFPRGAVTVYGNYIFLVTGAGGRFEILQFKPGNIPAQLRVNRNYFRFFADREGRVTPPQSFAIDTPGSSKTSWSLETLNWMLISKIDWIKCSQTSGTGSAEIMVSIDPAKIEEMHKQDVTYSLGVISISSPNAFNSGFIIWVSINIEKTTEVNVPFGEFSTPLSNTIVSGSIPVTGWALDNIGVAGVQIFREAGDQLVFVGNAVFVEGARPDVEIRYPDYPNYSKAGWGYMLLTQGLPVSDGPITLQAIATDMEGNRVKLGATTVTIANIGSVKPFGSIDTPGQGETISGRSYMNFGWALTPQPNTIPVDASTIRVWIDGVMVGQPVYNQYRQDVAELFPGFNNSNGAVGYFALDTTKYTNGLHTIAWSAMDDAGNSDGIGSRYFCVRNGVNETTGKNSDARDAIKAMKDEPNYYEDLENAEKDMEPVRFTTGFDVEHEPETAEITLMSNDDINRINIRELERVEIDLDTTPGDLISGYLLIGGSRRPLPIGSTLDKENGIFFWQPGPGFIGDYKFIFIKTSKNKAPIVKRLVIHIAPR